MLNIFSITVFRNVPNYRLHIFVKTNQMARKLTSMTWDEVQANMSIAGSPEKITKAAKSFLEQVNGNQGAELINAEFALQRLLAEIRAEKRRFERRTGQHIR